MPIMRHLVLFLSLLLVSGLVTQASPLLLPPAGETLVEGHTVFTVLDANRFGPAGAASSSASVAATFSGGAVGSGAELRSPGVLWFSGQYLVMPGLADGFHGAVAALVREEVAPGQWRHPCGGALLLVNMGDPDPRLALARIGAGSPAIVQVDPAGPSVDLHTVPVPGPGFTYADSSLVTDPSERTWIIDRYIGYASTSTNGWSNWIYFFPVWVVNMGGSHAFVPDDGILDCPPSPPECAGGLPVHLGATLDMPCTPHLQTGRNGVCYDAGAPPCATHPRAYNALLLADFEQLTIANHARDHSNPWTSLDGAGCHPSGTWSCPGGDDSLEGNSHAFAPVSSAGMAEFFCPVAGSWNPMDHGTSHQGAGACGYDHETRRVDLYYAGDARPLEPAVRRFTLTDLEGSNEYSEPFADMFLR